MIFGAFERMLAGRYLRARRQEGFVSVIAAFSLLGIALGVGTLIVVMSVMGGVRTEFISKILGVNAHISVYGTNGPLMDYNQTTQKLRALPHVIGVVPLVEGQALLTVNGYSPGGVVVRGIKPEDLARKALIAQRLAAGKLEDFGEDRVAIGLRMAEHLNLKVGDDIVLVSPKMTSTPLGSMLHKGTFEVAAIFDVGMYEIDSGLILMPLDTAQSFFQTGEGVTFLETMIDDPEGSLALVDREIGDALGAGFRILDWKQVNSAYLNAVDVESSAMFLILTLIIVVAVFNIISSLIMLVKDKGADIAILRTMGATRGMVMRIFFLTGASIGTIGAVTGVVLGVLFVRNIENIRHWVEAISGRNVFAAQLYFFTQIPAKLDWTQVTYIVAIALALTFAASIIPAWRASRIDPVEALRYE